MTRRRWFTATLIAFALGVALTGCRNPFLPAQAPAPTLGGGTSFTPDYGKPDGVLSTVSLAIGARGTGIGESAYLNAFADSATYGFGCTFTLDDSVVAAAKRAGAVVPDQWRLAYETAFYRYLSGVSSVSGEYEMTFVEEAPAEDSGDRTLLHQTYVLTAGSGDNQVQVATGKADIEMRQVTSPTARWVITAWSDHLFPGISATPTDPGEFCFSRLRIDSFNAPETTP